MPRSTTSPVFSLSGVPKGTAKLSLHMTDHDASYDHGGGVVPYTGKNIIPCGAIASGWVGPFPPGGQTHTYEFSIKALDSSGAPLATASAIRRFPRNSRLCAPVGAVTGRCGSLRAERRVEPRSIMRTQQRQAETPSPQDAQPRLFDLVQNGWVGLRVRQGKSRALRRI
jgi:hypothetical protein